MATEGLKYAEYPLSRSDSVLGAVVKTALLEYDTQITKAENIARFQTVEGNEFPNLLEHFVCAPRGMDSSLWATLVSNGTAFYIGEESSYARFLFYTDSPAMPPSLNVGVSTNPDKYSYRCQTQYGGSFTSANVDYSRYLVNKVSYAGTYDYNPNDFIPVVDNNPFYCLIGFYAGEEDNIVLWGLYDNLYENDGWKFHEFTDLSLANAYIQNIVDPPEDPPTPPEPEEDMEYPNSKLSNLFTTMYIMSFNQVNAIAKAILLKGADYSGEGKFLSWMGRLLNDMGFQNGKVTDAILDICVYPFDVSTRNKTHNTTRIKLGYGPDVTSGDDENMAIFSLEHPYENISVIDLLNSDDNGNFACPRFARSYFDDLITKFNDFRDYPPYRTFELYIPYVGIVPIDQRKFYGKYFGVDYIIDYYSGTALVVLYTATQASGNDIDIVETYDCPIGVHQSVSSTNWVEYASRVGSARRNIATNSVLLPFTRGSNAGSIIQNVQTQFNTQGVYTGNVNGTNSGMANYFMPNKLCIIQYTQETSITGNLNSLAGRSSNTSAPISSFSGFLQCSDVELNCPRATDTEKAKILSMLTNGIKI